MKSERQGIRRIAELANVAIGTVDRALHGRNGIKESTRHHILQIARQIGYTPNLAARALSVSKSGVRIGVCIPREIRFFYDQLWSGVLDEARRVAQLGVELLNRPVPSLGVGDTEAFEELVESGVQGIILTAGDPEGLKPLIDSAEEKGIHVVCLSTDSPESRRSTVICVEPRLNGCLAGELMGKFVPPGSKVALIAGMLSAEDHRRKTDGFSEAFPRHCPGGTIVTVIEGHEDEDESFQKTFDLFQSRLKFWICKQSAADLPSKITASIDITGMVNANHHPQFTNRIAIIRHVDLAIWIGGREHTGKQCASGCMTTGIGGRILFGNIHAGL